MRRNPVKRRLVILASVMALFCTGSISARLAWLQIHRHDQYIQQARNQLQNIRILPPRRGDIHDRHGNELALSVPSEMVIARPHLVADPEDTARLLAPILSQSAGSLEKTLRGERKYVRLLQKATPSQCDRIRTLQKEDRLVGIGFESWRRRIYPHETLAAHVLGFVRNDGNPGGGLESRFNRAIHGTNGRAVQSRDARKDAFDMRVLQPARPGHDLELTLDLTVQHVLEEELAHAIRKAHARAGAAVAMDPATGEILAMASWPTFNPNEYSRASEEARRDRVVVSAYEPGSTFKIITAAAALEAGKVRPNEVIHCNYGYINISPGHGIKDHKRFGDLTFTQIIARSSNVGAIKVGLRLDDTYFYNTIRKFGFGEKTGVRLPGEQRGLLSPPARWSKLSKPSISIGQEIRVTPLQMLAAVATVANDGMAMSPWLTRSLRDGETGVITYNQPPDPRFVISSRTARTLTRMLEEVVLSGTGRAAAVPGYQVAGKTGTAQKPDLENRGNGYLKDRHVASFVGYAPSRQPRLAAIFVIDEPRVEAYHGGDVAAPAFGRFMARVLPGLGAEPQPERSDLPQIHINRPAGSGARWASLTGDRVPRVTYGRMADGVMPDLGGHSLREAVAVLTSLGISPALAGQGRVLSQDPPAGSPLPSMEEGCRLWLGRR
ncbi:MAG: PASTA domain-containing protein [Acidobacteria bacterium]|nr:MAG: PASTA domain-containing protein [Acidobacteriota bacterium]